MPHCIIEHSDNIIDTVAWDSIFKNLHKILVDTGEFIEADIKSRVIKHNNFYIGDGNPNQAFVTLNIQLLDGRSDQFKKDLAQTTLNFLCKYFTKTLNKLKTSISVQISNIHRNSYSKISN